MKPNLNKQELATITECVDSIFHSIQHPSDGQLPSSKNTKKVIETALTWMYCQGRLNPKKEEKK